jgi:hypothetical protein
MRIVYRVSEEDFIEAGKLRAPSGNWYRRLSGRPKPWEGGFVLLIGITSLIFTQDRLLPEFLCLMGIYFLYCSFAVPRYFRNQYRSDPSYRDDFTVDISEEGIQFVTVSVDVQMKWSSFVRYLESDKIFKLYHSAVIFNIIPKRAFAPGEADTFRELLIRNIHSTSQYS